MATLPLSVGTNPLLANKRGLNPMHHAAARVNIGMVE